MVNISDFSTKAWDYIQTNLASAVIIILVGVIISYLLGRIVRKILKEIELDNITHKTLGLKLKLENRISYLVTYLFYIITVFIALTKLEIGYYVMMSILVIIGVILIVSLLLWIYDFVPDFLFGLIIKNKSNFKKGQDFVFGNIKGKIKKITSTNFVLETSDNDNLYIPNRTIRKNIKNILIKN